eukprot:scaffold34455_cov118-Isochrysis_galbana.AAC.3
MCRGVADNRAQAAAVVHITHLELVCAAALVTLVGPRVCGRNASDRAVRARSTRPCAVPSRTCDIFTSPGWLRAIRDVLL